MKRRIGTLIFSHYWVWLLVKIVALPLSVALAIGMSIVEFIANLCCEVADELSYGLRRAVYEDERHNFINSHDWSYRND